MAALERLAHENFEGFRSDLERHGIDCDLELTGDLSVALEPHELDWLEEGAELLQRFGHEHELFDTDAMQAEVASPMYLGGLWDKTDAGLLDPGKLAVGLADAARAAGVRVNERSRVTGLRESGERVAVRTAGGVVLARRVLLATSAYPPLLRTIRRYVAPIYDYAIMTEPLTPAQRRRSAGAAARASATARTSSITTAYRPTTGFSGAATTPCTATAGRSARTSTTTRRRS